MTDAQIELSIDLFFALHGIGMDDEQIRHLVNCFDRVSKMGVTVPGGREVLLLVKKGPKFDGMKDVN